MTRPSDQNLLFGVLALQMDFVRLEGLIAAVNTWLQDKNRSLAEILVEQGALTAADRDLLAPLVARHVANHEGDPRQSLAALSSAADVAAELRTLGDASIDATLSVLTGRSAETHVVESASADRSSTDAGRAGQGGSPDSNSGRFRILRTHARGGLGEVYLARDVELNRDVALKEIQTRFAHDQTSRARFLMEAEVTGGLEHPGIVPVYGLGRYDDGRPFYAMRFIKGDSLREATERLHGRGDASTPETAGEAVDYQSLEFRKLLGRLVDVCQAIEYAHSRGVLHRDLKPGNIMLGKYGETLVVDWGLAKTRDRGGAAPSNDEKALPVSGGGTAPTAMGSVVGTPAFMPPEQAAGNLDQLGPASDVYSLGATLYYVLAGEPPFADRDMSRLVDKVKQGEFQPPRKIRPGVPAPLNSICLKAMSLRPEDRYRSPAELGEDIENWLADEPVAAHSDSAAAAAGRWMRKHPAAVGGLGAAITVGMIALALFSAVITGKNRDLEQANGQLVQANEAAEAARRQANANLQMAQSAVDDFLTEVSESPALLGDQEGTQSLRAQLLEKAADYYERFLGENNAEALGEEVANAHYRLANAQRALGRLAAARESLQRALEIRGQLLQEDQQDASRRHQLSRSYTALGVLARQQGDLQGALKLFNQADATQRGMTPQELQQGEYQAQLAYNLSAIGVVLHELGQTADALEKHRAAIALQEELVQRNGPLLDKWRFDLSNSHHNLGLALTGASSAVAAAEQYQRAVRIRDELVAQNPRKALYRSRLANSCKLLGMLQVQTGETETGLDSLQRSLDLLGDLQQANPQAPKYKTDLANAYISMSNVLAGLHRKREAAGMYERAITMLENRLELSPDSPGDRHALSTGYHQVGQLHWLAGDAEEAIAAFERGVAVLRALVADFGDRVEYRAHLAVSLMSLGSALDDADADERGRAAFQEAQGILEALVEKPGAALTHRYYLAGCYNNFANLLNRTDPAAAEELIRKSVANMEVLVQLDPSVSNRGNLAAAYINLASVLDGDPPSEIDACTKGIRLARELMKENPQAVEFQIHAAGGAVNMAVALTELGDYEPALPHIDEARRLLVEVLRQDPGHRRAIEYHDLLQRSHQRLLKRYAWRLATHPKAGERDGARAVRFATVACEMSGWKDWEALDALAAAYAEAGNFEEAVRWQTQALEAATAAGDAEDAGENSASNDALRARLQDYQQDRPFRETNGPSG